jgi:hypothetical protein
MGSFEGLVDAEPEVAGGMDGELPRLRPGS